MNDSKQITPEHLIEALEKSYGVKTAAIEYIKTKFRIKITRQILDKKIDDWGMEYFIFEQQRRGVELAISKTFANALEKGNEKAISWILNTYLHHAEFLKPKEDKTLEMNKGDISQYFQFLRNKYEIEHPKTIEETSR